MEFKNYTIESLEEMLEAIKDELKDREERHKQFIEQYESDCLVNAGWAQQDMINLRRLER